ncbi:MAG: flagellar motor protein MotB [Alphaproteobacteria bacterium]|nr:flagellar motor protein MotB [Alphaproteobacteria bacterium]
MAKTKVVVEKDSGDDWLGTYGDMVTLLMCFFVLLSGASKIDAVMFEQLSAGLAKGLGNREIETPIEGLRFNLDDAINAMQLGDAIGLGMDSQGIVMEFASSSFHEPGETAIKDELQPIFKKIAGTLTAERYSSFEIEIQGHTDNTEAELSKYISAWELSGARASAVVKLFIETGIDKSRMRAVGMADIAPTVPNRDAYGEIILENQRKNRRVIIHVTPRPKK